MGSYDKSGWFTKFIGAQRKRDQERHGATAREMAAPLGKRVFALHNTVNEETDGGTLSIVSLSADRVSPGPTGTGPDHDEDRYDDPVDRDIRIVYSALILQAVKDYLCEKVGSKRKSTGDTGYNATNAKVIIYSNCFENWCEYLGLRTSSIRNLIEQHKSEGKSYPDLVNESGITNLGSTNRAYRS